LSRPPLSTLFPYTTLFRSSETNVIRREPIGCNNCIANLCGTLVKKRLEMRFLPCDEQLCIRNSFKDRCEMSQKNANTFIFTNTSDRKSTRLNSSHLGISYA